MRSGDGQRFVVPAVLLVSLLVRLPFIAVDPGVSADPALLLDWALSLKSGGGSELLGSTGAMVLYPPLSIAFLWLTGTLGTLARGAFGVEQVTLALIKLGALVADVVLAWLVASQLRGRSTRVRAGAAAAIGLNPALWYLSAVWGQIDSVGVLLTVAAAGALASGRAVPALVGWAAAVGWKLQALPLGALVIIRALRTSGVRSLAIGLGAGALVVGATLAALFPVHTWPAYFGRLWQPGSDLVVSGFNGWHLALGSAGLAGPGATSFVAARISSSWGGQ